MNIFYYDTENFDYEEIAIVYQDLKRKVKGEIIALPKDFKLLLDCNLNQLEKIYKQVGAAIEIIKAEKEKN